MKRSKLQKLYAVFFFLGSTLMMHGVFASPLGEEVRAGASASLSFSEVLDRVLAYYPRLKSQQARVEEAIAAKFEAYAALLPQVQGLSSVTRGDDPVYVFGSHLRQEQFAQDNFELSRLNHPKARTNYNFTLHAEMPLFNAFQTLSKIRSSGSILKAEKSREAWSWMEARLVAIEGYLSILRNRDNLSGIRKSRDAGLNDLKQAEKLKDQGMVFGADFYAARVLLGGIRQLEIQTGMDEKTAQILLNIVMGESAEASYALEGTLSSGNRDMGDLQTWLTAALNKRPDLIAFQHQVEAQRIEMQREKLSALPKVGAFADLTEDTHDLRTGGENYVMGIQGRVDILDAGYWARRKKAKQAYEAVLQEYQAYKDQVLKDVSQAVNGYQVVQSNLPVAEEMLQDALEAVKQTEVLYREGRKSIADLLEMRQTYVHALTQRNHLQFQSEMAYANLLFLTGCLDEDKVRELARSFGGV